MTIEVKVNKQTDSYLSLLDMNKALQSNVVHVNQFSNFFDWFSRESSLPNRAKKLVDQLSSFLKKGLFVTDKDEYEILFENNCPIDGNNYDDFRICNKAQGDIEFGYCKMTGHRNNKTSRFWFRNDSESATKLVKKLEELKADFDIDVETGFYVFVDCKSSTTLLKAIVLVKDEINGLFSL